MMNIPESLELVPMWWINTKVELYKVQKLYNHHLYLCRRRHYFRHRYNIV